MGCWGKAAEGYWVFSSGLTVLLHFRPSTGGFRCALPREWRSGGDSLEWNYLRLNPLENPLRVDLRPFPPQGCLFGCCGCREGIYGRCWGLSEAFQGGSGGRSSPAVLGGGGLWMARTLFSMEPRDRGRRRSYRWSCCPEPGSESRFRISAEPGAAAWWGDPPGSLTIRVVHSLSGSWALGFQPRKNRRPEEKYFKYPLGIIEKKFYFFQKGYLATGVTFFTVPVLIISYL